MKRSLMVFVPLLTLLATASSCNVYKFMDSPSGDAQKLSAARAAFDSGDLDTAAKYYQELCTGSANETGETACGEDAFRLLDKNGIGMGTFIQFALDIKDGAGTALTKLAKRMHSARVASGVTTTGLERRKEIQKAMTAASKITDPNTKGFVQFVTGIAMVGEILSEAVDSNGKLLKTKIVKDPDNCKSDTCPTAYDTEFVGIIEHIDACAAPADTVFARDASAELPENEPTEEIPTLDNFTDAFAFAYEGIQTLNPGSDSKSASIINAIGQYRPSATVTQQIDVNGVSVSRELSFDGCYRQQLLSFSIGE